MPLDSTPTPSTEEIEAGLQEVLAEKPPTKGHKRRKRVIPNLPPMKPKKAKTLEEGWLDPATYRFSSNTELGEVHEYLMQVFLEEGKRPADVLEMGYRVSSREDCTHSMLTICNALSDLAQVGKIRVKRVVTTNDRFHLYGTWAEV
jgi:hypothetical protein